MAVHNSETGLPTHSGLRASQPGRQQWRQTEGDAANALFDQGDYTGAISAYQVILEQVPQLTSLNLQIGHAYKEIQDFSEARAAYSKVPSNTPASKEAESALQELDNLAPAR